MIIPFTKMHGAGNDFIVVDDRALSFPLQDRDFLAAIGSRRTGIGCDGILLIQPSDVADFRMRFINPDGGEVEMCGNGARCIAKLAYELGAAGKSMTIETGAGLVKAEVLLPGDGAGRMPAVRLGDEAGSLPVVRLGDEAGVPPASCLVCLELTPSEGLRQNLALRQEWTVDFLDTGVPHAVVWVDDVSVVDLPKFGAMVRNNEQFSPAGTNANFAAVESDGSISVRTYERGVEGETLACGTGATAVGLLAAERGWVKLPVTVHCAGGFDLVIDSSPERTTLTGGAVKVFEGTVEYGNRV